MQNTQLATLDQTVTELNENQAWQQVRNRDAEAGFFYAVMTTGVFCRPSCRSRQPRRENVRYFKTVGEAERAGFRPCKRCKPLEPAGSGLAKIRAHIERNMDRHLGLEELGRIAGLSPFTVQRMFKQSMGVSPLQYQRALRAMQFRGALKKGQSVTDAIYNAGFSSSSRGYEGAQLGMTPARFAKGGRGEQIRWWTARSPFGWVIVGATERGLCWLSLGASEKEAESSLREEFPEAKLRRDPAIGGVLDAALASVREGSDLAKNASFPDRLDLRGTVFQLRVWQALRQIPRGETRTYGEVARAIGEPNATRAVAHACAVNRVALVVPCHRVVGADGKETGYRWGVERKRKLLEAERD